MTDLPAREIETAVADATPSAVSRPASADALASVSLGFGVYAVTMALGQLTRLALIALEVDRRPSVATFLTIWLMGVSFVAVSLRPVDGLRFGAAVGVASVVWWHVFFGLHGVFASAAPWVFGIRDALAAVGGAGLAWLLHGARERLRARAASP